MQKIHVTHAQFLAIKDLCSNWDQHARWLPKLDQYLWEQDIRIDENSSPQEPLSYKFLVGGVDHIDESPRAITVHDRCMQRGDTTEDGTTRFYW